MEENIIKLGKIALGTFVLILGIRFINNFEPPLETTQIEVYCIVEDKNSSIIMAGKAPIRKYYVDVRVLNTEEKFTDTVHVSSVFYDAIEIGDEVKGILFYTDNGMQKIEIME